ncbi:MAG: HupE/UreJ family protein [Cyanobacteria bacterium]|nr:HupE/UreJ family protein [Cyanobacteriota bacterium]MDW8201313.1 HupE/UreJ family protein [Cyanobacteriota bacterium SKYGB_h_bin112]
MNRLQNRAALLLGTTAITVLLPTIAQAHTGQGAASGFWHGVTHPIGGLDHILAMVAVGIWASQIGGKALWIVPLSFVGVMALSGIAGMAGVPLPLVEQGIVLSVLVLGVLIAATAKFPLPVSAAIVGLLAIFHGYAHGAEMPDNTTGLLYGLGFVISTALLHAIGIGAGWLVQRFTKEQVIRYVGGAIALSSLYLWFA